MDMAPLHVCLFPSFRDCVIMAYLVGWSLYRERIVGGGCR